MVVGAAARLDPVKDLATLVRGFAEAKKSVPGLKLIIAGEGAERPNLEALAAELGVADSVTLAGWLDDMDEYYGALDINTPSAASPRPSPTPSRRARRTACPRSPAAWAAYRGSSRTASPAISSSPATRPRSASAWRAWRRTRGCVRGWARRYSSARRATSPWRPPAASSARCTVRYSTARRNGGRAGVLICGAYGMGNAGDEAILDAITAEMRSIDPLMPITVLSRDPEGAETAPGCGRDTHLQRPRLPARHAPQDAVHKRRRQPDTGRHQPPEPVVLPLHAARGAALRLPRDDVRLRHRAGKAARRRAQHAPDASAPAWTSSRSASRTAWRSCTASAWRARS